MTTSASNETINRTLYTCPSVQIYAVPPLTSSTSSRGYIAKQWTLRPAIFTASLHIIETATETSSSTSLTVSIRLQDPTTAELFAAAPYTHPAAVTPCADSTRFFAVRVQGDGGMKATLGVGFAEKGEAFDFAAALEAAGRVLGFGGAAEKGRSQQGGRGGHEKVVKRELRLKEGEMMNVYGGEVASGHERGEGARTVDTGEDALFSIAPPPPPADATLREADGEDPAVVKDEEEEEDDGFGDFQ